jgi:hypothetical protein
LAGQQEDAIDFEESASNNVCGIRSDLEALSGSGNRAGRRHGAASATCSMCGTRIPKQGLQEKMPPLMLPGGYFFFRLLMHACEYLRSMHR